MKRIIFNILKWIGANKLNLFLALLAFIILGYPLARYGIDKTFFYSIDPDIVYTTNALLYTKARIIVYMDHPGTPTIVLLSYMFVPLRLIVKYAFHKDFIQWSFDNYSFLTYYLRTFQLIVSSIGLLIFLSIIKRMAKSKALIIIAFCFAFSFAGMSTALSIVPENLSFFLTAIWLAVFLKFMTSRSYLLSFVLAAISGFAFANKFTSLFLVIVSVFLSFYIHNAWIGRKLVLFATNIGVAVLTFLLGIKPILGGLTSIINWGENLFYHPSIHGSGAGSIFDWGSYSSSVALLVKSEPILFVFILLTIALGIYLLTKKSLKINDPAILVMFISLAGILIFAKYPVIHYQYVNIFLMVFCATYFLSKLKLSYIQILLPIAIIVFLKFSVGYFTTTSGRVADRPAGSVQNTLNMWTPLWSADIFRKQLDAVGYLKP